VVDEFTKGVLFVLAFETAAIVFGILTKQLKFEWWRDDEEGTPKQ
jgi:predicted branched-subunit amino acid permease